MSTASHSTHAGPGLAEAPWRVLIVDDEPAVHEVSRLLLADASFEGRPVELASAWSAAQARDDLARHPGTALVLLDVVMETDDAGLALVRHIREHLRDRDIQIVLRTGQPGMAPERDVVLRHDINGYFLKTEITAQKLYSIVISSLRAFRYIQSLRAPEAAECAEPHRAGSSPLVGLDALDDTAPVVLAQPEIALASGQPAGVELVPQWRSREGLLGFARVAESLDADPRFRGDVEAHLLRLACSCARSWRDAGPRPVHVSMPLSAASLADSGLPARIRDLAREFATARGALDLQVPESVLQALPSAARDVLGALRADGVSITLVDFGLGVISLPLLYRVQPDRLKIHRAFVRGVSSDPERAAMARSIIALAHTLGIASVADGIASDADLQFFKWEGCDVGAGDLPVPAVTLAEVPGLLATGRLTTH